MPTADHQNRRELATTDRAIRLRDLTEPAKGDGAAGRQSAGMMPPLIRGRGECIIRCDVFPQQERSTGAYLVCEDRWERGVGGYLARGHVIGLLGNAVAVRHVGDRPGRLTGKSDHGRDDCRNRG